MNRKFFALSVAVMATLALVLQQSAFSVYTPGTDVSFNYHHAQGQVLGSVTPPANGLVGYWNLDEGSGSVANDTSGSGNNGSLTSTSWVAGHVGNYALSFNGSSSKVTVPAASSLNLAAPFSVSFWTNLSSSGSFQQPFGRNDYSGRILISSSYGGYVLTQFGNTLQSNTNVLSTGAWHNVVYVANTTGQTLYVDNAVVASDSFGTASLANSNALLFGNSVGSSYPLKGSLDDVRIYNRALTASEVAVIYNYTGGGSSGTLPTINSFTANPTTISSGQSSTLSWSTTNATSVSISPTVGNVATSSSVSVSPASTTTYTLTATNSVGSVTSTATVTVSVPDTSPPTVPQNPAATAVSSSQINLTWTASTDNVGVTGYKIYRGGVQIGTSVTNSYSDTGLTPSTQYTYTVSAYDAAGNNSAQSTSASATTLTASSLSAAWREIAPPRSGTWPYMKGWTSLVYDPVLHVTLNYTSDGGGGIYSNSLWTYSTVTHNFPAPEPKNTSGSTTSYVCSTANYPGDHHPYQMVYDTTRGRLWTYGGANTGCPGIGKETWYFSSQNNTWTQVFPATNPGDLTDSAKAFVPDTSNSSNDRIVLFGGYLNGSNPQSTTWYYYPATNVWQQVNTTASPGTAADQFMVYDPLNKKVVMYGGTINGATSNDIWILDPFAPTPTWTNPNPSIKPPVVNMTFASPMMAFDTTRNQIMLHNGPSSDWIYNVATNVWQQITTTVAGPDPLSGGYPQIDSMAYDSGTDTFVAKVYDPAAGGVYEQFWELKLSGGDTTPPTVPTNLVATAVSSSQINLSWTASTDNVGVTGYKIYRGGVQVGTSVTNSYNDNSGLLPSTQYTYTVSAYDAAGNNSAQSTSASATTQAALPIISSFTASPTSITSGQTSTLSWAVSGDTSLSINNGLGSLSNLTSGSVVVAPSVTTTYILSATNSAGTVTATATVTVNQAPDTTPPVVTLSAQDSGGNSIVANATVDGSITITVTATDPTVTGQVTSGLNQITLSLDGTSVASSNTSTLTYTLSTKNLLNISHSLVATAIDMAGNSANSQTFQLNEIGFLAGWK